MKLKKILAAVVSVAMILSCVVIPAYAEEASTEVTTAAAVKVNEDGYETLANALEKAKAMTGDVTVEIYDKVTLDQNLNGSYSSIKFVGKTDSAEIYIDLQGYVEANGKNVAFENLTLSKSDAEYIYNAGFMNVAFGVYQASSVSYTDCTFANGAYASKGINTFTKCTFKRSHDKYGLWAYGDVEVIVDSCTFADYRGIKMYAEGAAKTVDLTVKNTNFSAVTDKPAIVLTYGESVTLEGNTYSPTGVFELDLDGAPNGTPVTSDVAPTCKNDNGACGVLVDGNIYTTVAQAAEVATKGSTVTLLHNSTETVKFAEGVTLDKNGFAAENVTATQTGLSGSGTEAEPYLINNLAELKWFRDQVDLQSSDGTTQFTGKYFKLTNDINLDEDNDGIGEKWNPIGSMSGDHGSFKGIFDGDGHTISNLYVETAGNGLGLFARTAGNAVIKNLTINNATLKSTNNSNYLGAVVANSNASTKIENVHVTGKLNIEGRGYLGGISGHGYVVMNNCSVKAEGTIESSFWCVGGILGYGGEGATNITNSSVEGIGEGLLLTSAAGGIGSIIGMAEDNKGTQPISGSNLSAKNVDIKTYEGVYGTSYAEYALGYLYGGNPTSKLTGTLEIEDVTFETSTGNTNPPVSDAVASINSKVYFSLADALAAAKNGDTITVIADIADETVTVDKNLTITGNVTANNVSINANGCDELTVSNLSFTGNSWINSGTAEKLTVSGVTANVTPVNGNGTANNMTNSRSAFISLGKSEQQSLELTVENCNIVSNGGTDPILGWAAITKATITGNTFGSASAYQTNSDSVKFMGIAEGAEFTLTNNTVYSNYNGFVFGQNTTRDNAYTAVIEKNTFIGSADHVWIEVSGATTTNATILATSDNTVNGEPFTASDIKVHRNIKTWTSYAGVDIVTDENGKVIGGQIAKMADGVLAEGYKLDANRYVVKAVTAVAKIGDTGYPSVADALKAAQAAQMTDVTITLVGKTTKDSTDSFDLRYTTEFNSVTFKQEDASVPYYLEGIYTGKRTNSGTFVFDGVNIIVTGQYMFEGNVKLINNSVVKSITESNCFLYYSTTTVEPGSKLYGIIDDLRGGDLIVDGGRTDGEFNATPDVQDSIMIINWSGDSVTIKNGAYVKINAANEVGRLTVNAGTSLNLSASKLDSYQWIANNGTINTDANSSITTQKITGSGAIVIDATAFDGNDTQVINANMTEFTGTVTVTGNNTANYKITDNGVVLVKEKAVAKIGTEGYSTLEDALAAAKNGDTVTLISDVTVNATTIVDKDVTIDLNGKTISGISSESASYALITNKGDLTIKDSSAEQSGKITYKYTGASSNWSFAWGNYTIANRGTLTVDGGTIENTTNLTGHMYDAIDNYSGATATINGGTVSCPNYIAIRLFATSKTDDNSVTINGGTINGKFTIWPQNASSNSETPYKATLALNGGTITATEGGTALYISEFSDAFTITKADSVTLAEPEGYKWVNGKLTEDLLDTKLGFIRNLTVKNTAGEDRYQVILLFGIDSLMYSKAGFEITVADTTVVQDTKTVYTSYVANNKTYLPTAWGEHCNYICGLKVNFPTTTTPINFANESVTVRPFVENFDGSKTYGEYTTIDKIYNKQ